MYCACWFECWHLLAYWIEELTHHLQEDESLYSHGFYRFIRSLNNCASFIAGSDHILFRTNQRFSTMIMDIVLPPAYRSNTVDPVLDLFSANLRFKYGVGVLNLCIGSGLFNLSDDHRSVMFNRTQLFPRQIPQRINFPFKSDRVLRRRALHSQHGSGFYTLK